MIKNIFDQIYLITYVRNKDKLEYQLSELERIGFNDPINIKYSVNYNDNVINNKYSQLSDREIYVSLTHYQAIKEAYELGYNHILILEDDNCWLKDIYKIQSIIQTSYNYDYVNYSSILEYNLDNSPSYQINVKGANCYSLSRIAMKWFIDIIEYNGIYGIDNFMLFFDNNLWNGALLYYPPIELYIPPTDMSICLTEHICTQDNLMYINWTNHIIQEEKINEKLELYKNLKYINLENYKIYE